MLNNQPSYVWSKKIFENGQELHTYVSHVVKNITGYPREFFHHDPKAILNIVHPEDHSQLANFFEDINNAYDETMCSTYRIIHADKNIRWLRTDVKIIFFEEGYRQIIGATTDITKQKQAEIDLEISEKKYRLISENTKDVIWTTNLENKITYISPSVLKIMGYSQQDVMGTHFSRFFSKSTFDKLKKMYNSLLDDSKIHTDAKLYQAEYFRKDGKASWCEIKMSQMLNNGHLIGIQGSFTDINKRKEIEGILINNQKSAIDLLMSNKALFLDVNSIGIIQSFLGENFYSGNNTNLKGKNIISLIPQSDESLLKNLFVDNNQFCDKTFTDKDVSIRLFGYKNKTDYKFIILDQKHLMDHRTDLIESLSMTQLILWS